jgi:predicted MFS family arabinose efflux permease
MSFQNNRPSLQPPHDSFLTEPLLVPHHPNQLTVNDDKREEEEEDKAQGNHRETAETPLNTATTTTTDPNNMTATRTTRRNQRVPLFFMGTVLTATIPMFLFGFHTSVLNAPYTIIFPHHSTLEWSMAVSMYCIGGGIGAYGAGSLYHGGRRLGILMIFWINVFAGWIHVLTPNMMILILARGMVGIAGGAATVLTPVYLTEIAPSSLRGTIGTLTQLACVLGILASIVWELPFLPKKNDNNTEI